ncbi:MAG: DJ-1/PfpI family protein [bacterium]|nr:DJ-1/PfpI family protein [bacterium]
MKKRVLVMLAEGFEDVEALAPIDVLNRVGVDVTVAALEPGPVNAAYGNTIVPDISVDEVGEELYDGVLLPGGVYNANSLAGSPRVLELIQRHYKEKKLVAAICASPGTVLGEAAGILKGHRSASAPGFEGKVRAAGAEFTDEEVTVDGHVITGRGPGAALLFGLKLAEHLVGREEPEKLARLWRIDL